MSDLAAETSVCVFTFSSAEHRDALSKALRYVTNGRQDKAGTLHSDCFGHGHVPGSKEFEEVYDRFRDLSDDVSNLREDYQPLAKLVDLVNRCVPRLLSDPRCNNTADRGQVLATIKCAYELAIGEMANGCVSAVPANVDALLHRLWKSSIFLPKTFMATTTAAGVAHHTLSALKS